MRCSATKVYFSCPEDGCTKTYQSYGNLQKHLDAGKHLVGLERESTYDTIKKKWADTYTEVSGSYLGKETGPSTEVAVDHPLCKIPQGWALKTSRRAIRFTEKVKTHLKRIFLEDEETGKKASAGVVCSRIRNQRDGSGKKIFAKEEWLSADQIARYFSRLSVLYRSGRLALEQVNPDTTEDEKEDYVAEAEEITTRLEIQRQLELWSYNIPQLHCTMLHILRCNSQIVPFKVTRPVVQKFRLGHHWDRMNIAASLFAKNQPLVFQIN